MTHVLYVNQYATDQYIIMTNMLAARCVPSYFLVNIAGAVLRGRWGGVGADVSKKSLKDTNPSGIVPSTNIVMASYLNEIVMASYPQQTCRSHHQRAPL